MLYPESGRCAQTDASSGSHWRGTPVVRMPDPRPLRVLLHIRLWLPEPRQASSIIVVRRSAMIHRIPTVCVSSQFQMRARPNPLPVPLMASSQQPSGFHAFGRNPMAASPGNSMRAHTVEFMVFECASLAEKPIVFGPKRTTRFSSSHCPTDSNG